MLKMSENPPLTWPLDTNIDQFEGTWWVAHTKSRHEKAFAWDLCRRSIQYFIPMNEKVTLKRGRKFKALLPLFSGYVFFCGDEQDRLSALQTNRVANIIPVLDPELLVSQLMPIELALKTGEQLNHEPSVLPGTKCRVLKGPMMGTEGSVIEEKDKFRLFLQIEMLGQASSLEIDRDFIELIEN